MHTLEVNSGEPFSPITFLKKLFSTLLFPKKKRINEALDTVLTPKDKNAAKGNNPSRKTSSFDTALLLPRTATYKAKVIKVVQKRVDLQIISTGHKGQIFESHLSEKLDLSYDEESKTYINNNGEAVLKKGLEVDTFIGDINPDKRLIMLTLSNKKQQFTSPNKHKPKPKQTKMGKVARAIKLQRKKWWG